MKTNLEKELGDFDLCPLTRKCNPDEEDVENYCVCANYENCDKYLKYQEEKLEERRNG